MGHVILHHGTGAQDFELAGDTLAAEVEARIFLNVRRLLEVRDQERARQLLDELQFHIFPGRNHLGDEFHVLFTTVPLSTYEKIRKAGDQDRNAAKLIAEAVFEVEGPWIRFVAVGLQTITEIDGYLSEHSKEEWDVFISYASEDRKAVAEPLAQMLSTLGLRVWYDKFRLKVGDSLRKKIDAGLAESKYGVIILSTNFFSKHYPNLELDGLAQREAEGRKVLLPVWHKVTEAEVRHFSPPLADRYAIQWSEGVHSVAWKILEVVWPEIMEQLKEAGKRIKVFPEIKTGRSLVQIIDGAHGYSFANEDLKNEPEAGLVGGFLQQIQDWGDISGMLDASDRVKEEFVLHQSLLDLNAAGWKVFGGQRRKEIPSEGNTQAWLIAIVVVARVDVSEVFEVGDGRYGFFRQGAGGSNGTT